MSNYEPNGTAEDIKAGILHSVGAWWVSNEGTKNKPAYHVWVPAGVCCECDSAYADLSLAVARCNYLARNNVRF